MRPKFYVLVLFGSLYPGDTLQIEKHGSLYMKLGKGESRLSDRLINLLLLGTHPSYSYCPDNREVWVYVEQ